MVLKKRILENRSYIPVSSEMWCWRKMEISWTNHVKNAEVWQGVKEESNIRHTIQRRTSNWIGLILWRNCLLKHIIEGKIEGRIEVTEWRGRCKQLLDELKEMRGHWKLKEEAPYCTLWWTCFRKDYRILVRQTMKCNEMHKLQSNESENNIMNGKKVRT